MVQSSRFQSLALLASRWVTARCAVGWAAGRPRRKFQAVMVMRIGTGSREGSRHLGVLVIPRLDDLGMFLGAPTGHNGLEICQDR